MKWKRSKKAQQEAKAKAAAERAAKQNGTTLPKTENKSKRITEEDEALSSDHEDDQIDVGAEDSDPQSMGATSPNSNPHPTLIAPTPILGLPHPPALQLRPLLQPQQPPHPQLMPRPPTHNSAESLESSLSALLPAHLARLSQAAQAQGHRLHRPFVA